MAAVGGTPPSLIACRGYRVVLFWLGRFSAVIIIWRGGAFRGGRLLHGQGGSGGSGVPHRVWGVASGLCLSAYMFV